MTVTTTQLHKHSRRVDRLNAAVTTVLAAMRAGQALHCEFGQSGPRWRMSNGRFVRSEVARLVIASPDVAGVGDSLFADTLAQTFRYVEPR
jgi:hypothetical protein